MTSSATTPKLGVGIVGSGFMGRTWSEVASHHCGATTLAGVTGGRRADALAADYDVPRFGTLDDLLAAPGVDVVVLATPPAGHRDQATAAARAGKHLLVEKPMANSADDCQAMIDACDAAGVALGVVSQHRFRAAPAHVRQLLDSGAVGEVRMVRAIGPETGFWDTSVTQDEWKLDPAQQTAYASWAAHACDLLRWFVGSEARTASALGTAYGAADGPPRRSVMATYGFANAAMAQVWMSYDIPQPGLGSGLQFELVGADGIVRLDSYGVVELGRGDGWTESFRQPPFDPLDPADPLRLAAYVAQLDDLIDAARTGRRPLVDGNEGLRTVAMIDAAEDSMTTGTTVEVPR